MGGDNLNKILCYYHTKMNSIFDNYANKKYEESFVKPIQRFYADMAYQLSQRLPKGAKVLDIGAGPGSLAKTLAEQTGLEATIYGFEPSQTHNDGVELSKQLQGSNIHYIPKQGTITEVKDLFDLQGIDCIAFPRSSHEIAKSLGSKQIFFQEVEKLLSYLKPFGLLMISDPTYALDIRIEPENHKEEVELARYLLERQIGHSDPVDILFSPLEIISQMEQLGCWLQYYNSHPKQDLLEEMHKQKGFEKLARSPAELYVAIFQKSA